jgi:hypothetical protein
MSKGKGKMTSSSSFASFTSQTTPIDINVNTSLAQTILLHHLDLYRLRGPEDCDALELPKSFSEGIVFKVAFASMFFVYFIFHRI